MIYANEGNHVEALKACHCANSSLEMQARGCAPSARSRAESKCHSWLAYLKRLPCLSCAGVDTAVFCLIQLATGQSRRCQ
jgi:hypothetical protein